LITFIQKRSSCCIIVLLLLLSLLFLQFDFYDGGGLDIAFLGLAEFDPSGNVNVSRFGSTVAGVGGFINISQSTPRVVFMGTLTAGGLEAVTGNGSLEIVKEGRLQKLVPIVQHLRCVKRACFCFSFVKHGFSFYIRCFF